MTTEKRRTGRTTRMLEHAAELARQGRAVYVVFNMPAGPALREKYPDISFETQASLGPSLDLEHLRLRGAHPNCVLLVDHYVIERRFGRLFEMMTAYDVGAAALDDAGLPKEEA